jgi:raffinose/stachyose/melibiose transport system substrate-binding protein
VGAPAPLDEYYAKYGWTHVNAFYKAATPAMAISMAITGTWVLQDMIRGAKFGMGVFMPPPIPDDVAPGTMWGEKSQ